MNGVDDLVTANVDVVEVLNAFVASVLTNKVFGPHKPGFPVLCA